MSRQKMLHHLFFYYPRSNTRSCDRMSAKNGKNEAGLTEEDQLEILNAYVAITHKADKVQINAGDYVCPKPLPFSNPECDAIVDYFAEGPAYVLECLEPRRARYLGAPADAMLAVSSRDEIFIVCCDSRLLIPVSSDEKVSPLLLEFVKDTPLEAPPAGIAVRPRCGYHFRYDAKNAEPSAVGRKILTPAMVTLQSTGDGICRMAGVIFDGKVRPFSQKQLLVCKYK